MDRTRDHSLHEILMISLCAMLCGAEGFVDFERFGNAKLEWLSTFLKLPHGIPSHDTFGRVFSLLDPERFSECFSRWTDTLRKEFKHEIVAIDGKTLRRSHDKSKGKGPIHMVSAWSRKNGLVIGQRKVDSKSNEITAIPELLRSLKLAGAIVTIDAIGCQTKIVAGIRKAGAEYVIALKGNQSTLHEEVKSFIEDAEVDKFRGVKYDYFETIEKGHGRIDMRRYYVTEEIKWLSNRKEWSGLRSAGMVESIRVIGGKQTVERRFYICSIGADAVEFANAVRGHWAVENSLHWSLDVSFNEDQCRARLGNAAENLAILRHLALNTLKTDKSLKVGIKAKQKCAGWDDSYLELLLGI